MKAKKSISPFLLMEFFIFQLALVEGARKPSDGSKYRLISEEDTPFAPPEIQHVPYIIQKLTPSEGSTSYSISNGAGTHKTTFKRNLHARYQPLHPFFKSYSSWFATKIPGKHATLRRKSELRERYFKLGSARDHAELKSGKWHSKESKLLNSSTTFLSRLQSEICIEPDEDCGIVEYFLGTCELLKCICKRYRFAGSNEGRTFAGTDNLGFKSFEVRDMQSVTTATTPNSITSTANTTTATVKPGTNVSSAEQVLTKTTSVPSSLDPLLHFIPNSSSIIANSSQPFREPALTQYLRSNTQRSLRNTLVSILPRQGCIARDLLRNHLQEKPEISFEIGQTLINECATTKYTTSAEVKRISVPHDPVYTGYGNCLQKATTRRKSMLNFVDDLINYYLAPLKLNCNRAIANEIRSWFVSDSKFMRISAKNKFKFISDADILTKQILSHQEFKALVSSLVFASYASVYRSRSSEMLRHRRFSNDISSPTFFLIDVYLKAIEVTSAKLQHRFFEVTTFLAKSLKQKFYTLCIDYTISSRRFSPELDRIYYDAVAVMGLKEFVLNGIDPVFQVVDATAAFQNFLSANHERIMLLVTSYDIFKKNKY